jgi:general secretion pathway protein D
MKLNTYLLPTGIACALLLSVIVAHSQTNPLPPGLTRAPSTIAPPKSAAIPKSAITPKTTPSAASAGTTGADLLGVAPTSSSATTGSSLSKTNSTRLNFNGADSLILLMAYAEATGRTLIQAPDVPKATITLKSQPEIELSKEEYLEAIEKTLAMNGIVLEPDGTKFLKVFAKGKVRTEGIKTIMDEPEGLHPEMGRTISQMITFKFLAVSEGQKALEGFKKPDGLFQVFERTNTILVTDTQENINRMLEIVKFIDKPIEITDEVQVRTIKYAKAEDIKKRIDELVAESQKQLQAKEEIRSNTSGGPGTTRTTVTPTTTSSSLFGSRPLPPGLIRPTMPTTTTPTPVTANETVTATVNDADRGMIRGKVQVIADERSNKLIVVTRPENMNFFDKIIEVLDIPTAPDIQVKIIRLQHATADGSSSKDGSEKGIADILNELIGNASASKSGSASRSTTSGTSNRRTSTYPGPGGSQNLTSTLPTYTPPTPTPATGGGREGAGKVGELSKENITILSDKRINGLIVMASPTDMAIIEAIIKELDVELEQVIIETVLLQVQLTDTIKTGIDWIHSHVFSKSSISGMGAGGGGDNAPLNDLTTAAANVAKVAGAKYYFLFEKLDLNMVVQASKEDSRSKVLQSPVLMTVNNKEATLESTDMRYLYKGVRYAGSYNYGTEVPDYEQRDFGVTIKVTPRISPNGNVMLTVDQKFETLGTPQFIPGAGGSSDTNSMSGGGGGTSGGYFPTISTTKYQADVSIKSGQTVMLGGLVRTEKTVSEAGIPILKDIPWIGRYLFGNTKDVDDSKELVVFLTPYVVKGSDQAQAEARRRLENISMDGIWNKGWSDSSLAEPTKKRTLLNKEKRKFDQAEKERAAQKELDQLYKDKGYTPPADKTTTPETGTEVKADPTIKSLGQMRVIEEKTEPLLAVPSPEKAPAPAKEETP